MSNIERYCILASGDKHPSLLNNLLQAPVEVYLRDTERAGDFRGYIEMVQAIEALCFKMPSENWVLAHFGLNGPGMIVTAEQDGRPVAAQYVAADCWEGKMGLRFWTTVVHPEKRRLKIASVLTAISTAATSSWADFGGTICDTDSSLMGRNVKLYPTVVTANMHHTPGRRKVQLEWRVPDDPFMLLSQAFVEPDTMVQLPLIESLTEFELTDLPKEFKVSPQAQVWEDITLHPEKYRRHFKLAGWFQATQQAVLANSSG